MKVKLNNEQVKLNNKQKIKQQTIKIEQIKTNARMESILYNTLFSTQRKKCPKIVSLLAESYNAHVRYGACLALGISCAGTGLPDAVAILEPLLSDPSKS